MKADGQKGKDMKKTREILFIAATLVLCILLFLEHFTGPLWHMVLGVMFLAILMGCAGNLMAAFLTVLGGYGLLSVAGLYDGMKLSVILGLMVCFAVARGILRYAEQASNHYIAFKLLALPALVAYLLVGLVIPVINGRSGESLGQEYRNSFGELNTCVLDNLYGLEEILQYGQQEHLRQKDSLQGIRR